MITLKLCYERRNDSAAFFNVQLEIAPLYCFAAVLFVQDGGILYVKNDRKGGSLWRYQICSINIRLFCL